MVASGDVKDEPILGSVLDDEWGMEAFYNIVLTPSIQFTPSMQYILPGLDSIDHSTILAARLQIYF